MEKTIQAYEFQGQLVEFDLLPNANLMVNATEMAKIFGKDIKEYRSNKTTQEFIDALVLDANSKFAGGNSPVQIEEITQDFFLKTVTNAGQRNGTWMHRHLAIHFAMWLSPQFSVWVVKAIDEILFGRYRRIEQQSIERALIEQEYDELESYFSQDPKYARFQTVKSSLNSIKRKSSKELSNQTDLFKSGL